MYYTRFNFIATLFLNLCTIFAANLQAFESLEPNENLKRAEELFHATIFDEAIMQYQLILQDPQFPYSNDFLEDYVKLCLSQALYAEKKYAEAILYLESHSPHAVAKSEQTRLYLLSLCYRNLGKYEQAIGILQQYLENNGRESMPFDRSAKVELGRLLFRTHRLDAARQCFENVLSEDRMDDLNYLAQLNLGKIEFEDKQWEEADSRLKNLAAILPHPHLLVYEVAYWRGKVHYVLGNYLEAMAFFEQALPANHPEKGEEYEEVLYYMGSSCLALASIAPSPQEKHIYYDKAERIFAEWVQKEPKENAYLAQANAYISRYKEFKDEVARNRAEAILSQDELFISLEAKARALLLKAHLENSYEQRERYYKMLSDDLFVATASYSQGYYDRGKHHFQEAERLVQDNRFSEAVPVFAAAAYAFGRAGSLKYETDAASAFEAVKWQAKAYMSQHTKDGYLNAHKVLEGCLSEREKVKMVKGIQDPGEAYYLWGLSAALLSDLDKVYTDRAKKSLAICFREFPQSAYAKDSLFLLGSLQYKDKEFAQAEASFYTLVQDLSDGQHLPAAYFWLAKSLTKQQKEEAAAAAYRRKVFEEFPAHPLAAEAYFTLYSYKSYLQGERQAIKHLQSFQEKFPDSHLIVNAYYLMGMDAKRDRKTPEGKSISKKNLKASIEYFNLAETAFDQFFGAGKISPEDLNYYISLRYQCTLERALANLSIADESQGAKKRIFLEYAQEVLQQLCLDLKNGENPLARKLMRKEPFPKLLEESSYWLSQALIKSENYQEAEKELSHMLDNYKSAKITKGYFVSRVYYDLGMMAYQQKDYRKALGWYVLSEDAAKGKSINSDQKIDLWIQQSLCYRELDEMDKAMLILSKAINDEAISSLRVKAMFLRGELYSLQRRHDLARKQWESTSKNSGEWAQKAKQKLEEAYGY